LMKDWNENRPGYKKTKVGWIPENWECKPLNQITRSGRRIVYGIVQAGPNVEKGMPYIRSTDVGDSIQPHSLPKTSFEIASRYSRSEVGPGDIIFSLRGNIGATSIVPSNLPCANLTQGTARISVNFAHHNYFIRYCLNHFRVKKRILAISKGSTFKEISLEDLRRVCIPIPTQMEQIKIAEILSTWDKSIDRRRKLIEAKKNLKKGLMQQLLTGNKRLPPFNNQIKRHPYRYFELPEDWICLQMSDIAQEYSKRNGKRNNLPVLACSKYIGFVDSSKYFGKQVFSDDTSNYKVIRRGQFGFPSNHIEEGSIGLLQKHDEGLVSPIYTVFQCNEHVVVPEYLYAIFKTDTFKHIFKVSTNASVDRRGSLRWKEFSLIHVPLPSVEEQKAIVEVLNTVDEEIAQNEMKFKALEKQKRGLMQKLLTGELRVQP